MGNKWVFRIKENLDSSFAWYKAHLVSKGFHQQPRIDFHETFSLVIKFPSPSVLCLALHSITSGGIRQLDKNNVFLNGHLTEEVYMAQP